MIHFIKCADGKEREIFPAKIKHKDRIRHYTARFNSALAIANIIALDNGKIETNADTEDIFNEEPYEAMMEIVRLAFGEKYSVEEIEQFLDVEMIAEILDVFYGVSGYKKKAAETQTPIGTN